MGLYGRRIDLHTGAGAYQFMEYMGLSEEMAPTAASVTLVLLSALTTGLNVYDKLPTKPERELWSPLQALPMRPLLRHWSLKAMILIL